jgi:hypothetical protein
MKRVFASALVIVGVAFLVGGAYTAVRGIQARGQVRAELLEQNITTPEDAAIPNARVQDANTAHAMAEIIGVHADEATGGRSYAELGRFLTPDGGDTSDEAAALKDENGNPVANPLRDVAFQAATLQSSLHEAHLAYNVSELVIGIGAMILVLGLVIGGLGVSFGGLRLPELARKAQPVVVSPTS